MIVRCEYCGSELATRRRWEFLTHHPDGSHTLNHVRLWTRFRVWLDLRRDRKATDSGVAP